MQSSQGRMYNQNGSVDPAIERMLQPPTYRDVYPAYWGNSNDRLASALIISGQPPNLMLGSNKLRYVTQVEAGYPRALRGNSLAGFTTPMNPPVTPGQYEVLLRPIDLSNLKSFYMYQLTTQPTQVYVDPSGNDYFIEFWLKATALPNCDDKGDKMDLTLFEALDYSDIKSLVSMVKYADQEGIDKLLPPPYAESSAGIIATIKRKIVGTSPTTQGLCALIINSIGEHAAEFNYMDQIAESSIQHPEVWNDPLISQIIDRRFLMGDYFDGNIKWSVKSHEWSANVLLMATKTTSPSIKLLLFRIYGGFVRGPMNLAQFQIILKQLRSMGQDDCLRYFSRWMLAFYGMLPDSNPLNLNRDMQKPDDPHWLDPDFRKQYLDAWQAAIAKLQAQPIAKVK